MLRVERRRAGLAQLVEQRGRATSGRAEHDGSPPRPARSRWSRGRRAASSSARRAAPGRSSGRPSSSRRLDQQREDVGAAGRRRRRRRAAISANSSRSTRSRAARKRAAGAGAVAVRLLRRQQQLRVRADASSSSSSAARSSRFVGPSSRPKTVRRITSSVTPCISRVHRERPADRPALDRRRGDVAHDRAVGQHAVAVERRLQQPALAQVLVAVEEEQRVPARGSARGGSWPRRRAGPPRRP